MPNSPIPKIRLEKRTGKLVTVIAGLHTYGSNRLNVIARELKSILGAGGTVKNGTIEIQGDKVAPIKAWFLRLEPSHNMKKLIIVLALVLATATPSYAMNIIEKMIYKEVVLRNNAGVVVLVNRLTGQVEFVKSGEEYVHLEDRYKSQFQAVYNAQERPLRR